MVTDILTHLLLALPVLGNGSENLVHRIFALLKDVFLEGGETVGNGAKACTLDIGRVISGTTAIIVLTLLDAVVDIEAQEGGRGIEREHTLDVIIHRELQVHEVDHLLVPGLIEFLESLELTRIPRLESEFLARLWINTVIQGNLEDLRCVQITRQQISLLSKGTHLNTARTAALTGILQALTCTNHLLNISIRIEDGRIAVTLTDHLDTSQQELVGSILSDVDTQARLQFMQFFLNLENHIGYLIRSTLAVTVNSTYINISEVVVGA